MVYFKFEVAFRPLGRKQQRQANDSQEELTMTEAWEFVSEQINEAKARKSYKTAANYLTATNSLTNFFQRNNWTFENITPEEMDKYQRWLIEKGLCMNTVSCYMRSLRTLYNRAVERGLTIDKHPFRKVFTGKERTRKRSALEEDVRRLRQLHLEAGSSMAFARDIFLFGFYAMGMPFVDIAYLRKSQIKDGKLIYARHKTGQEIVVTIEPCMMAIINKYCDCHTEYVFPIITEETEAIAHKQYQSQLRLYNHNLANLSKRIKASQPLSSYVVRHTWASIAYKHQLDVSLISKALGHTNTSTTLIYIKSLFDPQLADANRSLLELLDIDK